MLGDYSIGDLGSIFVMQGFAGLILFSVYVLMALVLLWKPEGLFKTA